MSLIQFLHFSIVVSLVDCNQKDAAEHNTNHLETERESEREGERGREKSNVNAIHGAIRIASALYAILAKNL